MRSTIFALAACTALMTTAAYADPPDFSHFSDQKVASKEPAKTDADNQIICAPVTHNGVVMGKPVCMTKLNWERAQRQAARSVLEFQMAADRISIR